MFCIIFGGLWIEVLFEDFECCCCDFEYELFCFVIVWLVV